MDRLETVSNDLASSFKLSSDATKAKTLYFACFHAVRDSGLVGREVSEALEDIRVGKSDARLSKTMHDLSKVYDDKYFELTSDGEDGPLLPGALENFIKARTASALGFGLESDQQSDSLYEAVSASSNREGLITDILHMLQRTL